MKVYAQKQNQPQQKALLHPSQLTQHKILNQEVPVSSYADEDRKVVAGASVSTRFAHDFSRVPVHSKAPIMLQAKLSVNAPRDIYEQEADRVADQVTGMLAPQLQRKCACDGGHCSKCKNEQDIGQYLQAKRVQSNHSSEMVVPPIVHQVLRSSGHSLDSSTLEFMKSRFGHDFSGVRVHTDAKAAESARAVNALAYTVGSEVIFGVGQYRPHESAGRKLLAHELAHVVQQHDNRSLIMRKPTEPGRIAEEDEANAIEMKGDEKGGKDSDAPKKKVANCTRTIFSEGTCAFLVGNSRFICCDPDNGIERKGRKKDIDGNDCPSEKFTPIFTCDNKCDKALAKGCDDNDNWMAVPNNQFTRQQCGDIWTICANGKQTTGYVRDHSVTQTRFEVSPAIQKALGVPVGSSFKGSIYRPGANQSAIDKDTCCNS